MSEASNPDLDVLLRHGAWLRRLAFHLVGGGDGAEDAVQETWIAAMAARPSADRDLRPWLARVLRNRLRHQARTRTRRLAREQAATRAEPVTDAPAAEALERVELQRRLTTLVTELEEPFRSTLVLRYFEGRSAADIARESKVPEGTVRWRTKEGLDRLRARLDEDHGGDRRAWRALLLPLARGWRPPRPRRFPGAASAAALAVVVLVGAALVLVGRRAARGPLPGTASGWTAQLRSTLPGFEAGGDQPVPALEGMVLDPDGRGLPAAVVTARGRLRPPPGYRFGLSENPLPAALVVSGADGRFRIAGLPGGLYTIAAAHARHAGAYLRDVSLPRAERIELRLGRAGITLTGQVSDEGGGPIAGARLLAQGRWLAMFGALTSSSGEYRLIVPEEASELLAVADGYAPTRWRSRLERDERHDLRLAAGARVTGRVLADGRPAPGAIVRLMTSGLGPRDHWERSTVSGADGGFGFTDLPAAQFRPLAQQGSSVSQTRTPVVLRAGGTESVELLLEPGATVRGRVQDDRGQPVAEAEVGVQEAGRKIGWEAARGTLTGVRVQPDGRFVLEGVPPGPMELTPTAVGFAGGERTVQVGPQVAGEVVLVMARRIRISGTVLRSDGQPAADAQVRGHSQALGGGSDVLSAARPDAVGRFGIDGLGAGQVSLTAWTDREAVIREGIRVQAGDHQEVALRLEPGAFVSGQVRWEDGRPAVGATVWGHGERSQPGRDGEIVYEVHLEKVQTDAQGRFRIGPFLPGLARLGAFAPGERMLLSSAARPNQALVPVARGQQVTGAQMVISAGHQTIAGTTFAPGGESLAGATVLAVRELPGLRPSIGSSDARTTSGADGRFTIDGLSEGAFTVFARHPDHPDCELPGVRAGTTALAVHFTAAAQIAGVVSTRDGKPVRDGSLVVLPAHGSAEPAADEPEAPAIDLKNRRGTFSVSRLQPGRYDLTVRTRAGLVARASGVDVHAGELKRLQLIAEAGAVLIGRVVDDATGAPAAGVDVATWLPGNDRLETTTDGAGAFTLRGILPGPKLRVSAVREASDQLGRIETAVARPGQTIDVGTIRLRKRQTPAPAPAN